MADRMEREQIGPRGSGLDGLVRAAISYLDSPTNYRELLPRTDQRTFQQTQFRKAERQKNTNQISPRSSAPQTQDTDPQNGGLILLDNIPNLWPKLWTVTLIAIFLGMLLLVWLRN